MSILDNLDSGDLLSALLGVNTQTAVSTNGGEGSPLSAADMSPNDPSQNPGYKIQTAGRQPGAPPPQPPAQAAPPMPPANYMAGDGSTIDPGFQSPSPSAPTAPQAPAAPSPQQANVPMPTPDPRTINGSTPSTLAGVDDPAMVTGPQSGPTPGPGPAGIPPNAVPAQATPQNTSSDPLLTQLSGIQPAKPDKWGQFAAGVGRGLENVGRLPRGAGMGQAFAAGAGGGLSGAYAAGQKENEEFFKNTIAADNDWMKRRKFPHDLAHEDASTKYLQSGEQKNLINAALGPAAQRYGGKWANADIVRMEAAAKYADRQMLRWKDQQKFNYDTGREVDKSDFDERRQKFLHEGYDMFGVKDPAKAPGANKDTAIDASTMSKQDIETAPEGTFFKYKMPDGSVKIGRRLPYEIMPNPRVQQQSAARPGGDYAAEQAALAGGGNAQY